MYPFVTLKRLHFLFVTLYPLKNKNVTLYPLYLLGFQRFDTELHFFPAFFYIKGEGDNVINKNTLPQSGEGYGKCNYTNLKSLAF